jgi:hydrogenase/urease accessory protein HupE
MPLWVSVAAAHEVRPAYLQLNENRPGEYAVLWKVPMQGEFKLALEPQFSGNTQSSTPVTRTVPGATIETWTLHTPALRGQTLTIGGLEATMTDALVRVEFMDGTSWTARFMPREPAAVIPATDTALSVAGVYLSLGIEHILLGIDHLLFVLGLLLLVKGWRRVAATITAFTVAHSLTLAAATFGVIRIPEVPLNAMIALSILFLGVEIVRADRGEAGLGVRYPWLIAFAFGLLHGCGFASGLATTGLPASDIPFALLFFNLGVELGQLAFVGLFYVLAWAVRTIEVPSPRWARALPAYVVGVAGAYWTIVQLQPFARLLT